MIPWYPVWQCQQSFCALFFFSVQHQVLWIRAWWSGTYRPKGGPCALSTIRTPSRACSFALSAIWWRPHPRTGWWDCGSLPCKSLRTYHPVHFKIGPSQPGMQKKKNPHGSANFSVKKNKEIKCMEYYNSIRPMCCLALALVKSRNIPNKKSLSTVIILWFLSSFLIALVFVFHPSKTFANNDCHNILR